MLCLVLYYARDKRNRARRGFKHTSRTAELGNPNQIAAQDATPARVAFAILPTSHTTVAGSRLFLGAVWIDQTTGALLT